MNPKTANLKTARENLRSLIDDVLDGEEVVLLRRGKPVARLTPVESEVPPLPDLGSFRDSIQVEGLAMSEDVVAAREDERF